MILDSFTFCSQLLRLLSDEKHGHTAAVGFQVIVTESEDILTPLMHASIKLMFRQRFFMENLTPIVSGYEQSVKGKTKSSKLSFRR